MNCLFLFVFKYDFFVFCREILRFMMLGLKTKTNVKFWILEIQKPLEKFLTFQSDTNSKILCKCPHLINSKFAYMKPRIREICDGF